MSAARGLFIVQHRSRFDSLKPLKQAARQFMSPYSSALIFFLA